MPCEPGADAGSLTDQGGVGNDEPRDAANPVRALGGRVVIPPKLGSGLSALRRKFGDVSSGGRGERSVAN